MHTNHTHRPVRLLAAALVVIASLTVACTPTTPPEPVPTMPRPPAEQLAQLPSLTPCPTGTATAPTPLRDDRAVTAAVRAASDAEDNGRADPGQVVISTQEADGSGDLIVVDAEQAPATVVALIAQGTDVVSVEPNQTVRVLEPTGSVGATATAPTAPVAAPTAARSNDGLRARQWSLDRWRMETAWTISRGTGTRVAVIDTGVQADHPDLAGQVLAGQTFLSGGAVRPVAAIDGHGHGTHVAGTIAARTGNRIGIAGVAPAARIVPVKVLEDEGYGTDADVAYGIAWATQQQVDVINLSLGGPPSNAISLAVHHAICNGVTVVAAAGNSGPWSPPSYPAADEGVIGVAASAPGDALAIFSSHGSWVDVTAPGDAVLSTVPTYLNRIGYKNMSGTSMAAPHVAGVAALLASANPTWTPAEIAAALTATATDRGPAGRDDGYGHGVAEPGRALAYRPAPPPATR